jgi:uncharacterized protein YciU (UPF0263 family)
VVRFANEVAEADVVLFAVALPELGGMVVVSGAEDCAAEGAREKERRERRERKRE